MFLIGSGFGGRIKKIGLQEPWRMLVSLTKMEKNKETLIWVGREDWAGQILKGPTWK